MHSESKLGISVIIFFIKQEYIGNLVEISCEQGTVNTKIILHLDSCPNMVKCYNKWKQGFPKVNNVVAMVNTTLKNQQKLLNYTAQSFLTKN